MKGRDEEDVVARLELVGLLPLELPVGVVDEDKDAGTAGEILISVAVDVTMKLDNSHVLVQDEEVHARILHQVRAQIVDQKGHGDGLAGTVHGGQGDLVAALVVEEHLEAAAGSASVKEPKTVI